MSVEELTRPIIGIENRTVQEVFDIMSDRIRLAATSPAGDLVERVEAAVIDIECDAGGQKTPTSELLSEVAEALRYQSTGVTGEWPAAPDGWTATKPAYVRKDGKFRVEYIFGHDEGPWGVFVSHGNGASHAISWHATPQEALAAALSAQERG